MDEKTIIICNKALSVWGARAQILKTAEESIELADAAMHYNCTPESMAKLTDEMVDVSIMIDQMRVVLDISDKDFEDHRQRVYSRIWGLVGVEEKRRLEKRG